MMKYKILSTKKLEPSLLQQAIEIGCEIIEQEFISVKLIPNTAFQKAEVANWAEKQDVVFTSANAVQAVSKILESSGISFPSHWNIFCISGRTKAAITDHFSKERIMATADYGKDLAEKIVEHANEEVIFFCGNKRRDELPKILRQAGLSVHEVVVYETIETPVSINQQFDGVLFFSPSSVESFFSMNDLQQNVVCFAIGNTTAHSIRHHTNNKIIISESPTQEVLLEEVNSYFQNINCYE